MARHALGVLGVVAAGILLAVSAAMNYRFGFSLGKTALDGQIYGMASAARRLLQGADPVLSSLPRCATGCGRKPSLRPWFGPWSSPTR